MAVCRVKKTEKYTVMANYHLTDQRLSLKAVGLLSKMLSLPETWNYTIRGLASICKEGRDAIQSTLLELEENGYIQRQQLHSGDGKFGGTEYVIYEEPQSPCPGFPYPANPCTENPPQLNTKLLNTNNTPPIIPPEGDGAKAARRKIRTPKTQPDWKPERFLGLWEFYPIGKNKQAAIKAWDNLRPDDKTINVMALALMRQTQSEDWQRGIGIPHLSTWINQRRWEDEDREPKGPVRMGGWAADDEVLT